MKPNTTEGAVLQGITVQLDGGMAYLNCRFENCQLLITGATGKLQIEGCIFDEKCRWNFVAHAGNVFSLMRSMYVSGQRDMIEKLFEAIRTGNIQPGMPQPQTPNTPGGTVQ